MAVRYFTRDIYSPQVSDSDRENDHRKTESDVKLPQRDVSDWKGIRNDHQVIQDDQMTIKRIKTAVGKSKPPTKKTQNDRKEI